MSDAADPSALDAAEIEPLGELGPLLPDAGTPVGGPKAPWHARALARAWAWLPLVVMALLALGSWWLVQNTPDGDAAPVAAAPREDPDYTMRGFTLRRYTAAGPLKAQIDGDELRHYPATDTLEIDSPRLRMHAPEGRVVTASARRALSNGDASEVQLHGDARVERDSAAGEPPLRFRSEFLHAFLDTEQVRSHLPVVLTRGTTEVRGDSLHYDNLSRVAQLDGRVRAVFGARGGGEVPPRRTGNGR